MTDPVITDDEKDALLEGISSGEIEVHSTKGPTYASVTPFEVGPRSRIVTNSFPRLLSLNRQFAGRMGKQAEQLLNAETEVTFKHVESSTYGEFCERINGLSLIVEFTPEPLHGSALINLNSDIVETIVETFYGGVGNDSERPQADFFTPGEINVASLFCGAVLSLIGEVWQPVENLTSTIIGTHLSSGIIDGIDTSDSVICSEFEFAIGDKALAFQILWPVNTVAPLVPVFDGQKRERDAAQDSRWEHALRTRVIDANVNISSGVGQTRMTLGEVAELEPGDVVNISNPRRGTIFARKVPVIEGRFGIHDGRYAIEATNWLEVRPGSDAATSQ